MSHFDFKKFRVSQKDVGMKVTTDACIFGAQIELSPDQIRVLDVGTGTGLLSLMLAQRAETQNSLISVLGIDIDQNAIDQATLNFAESPWNGCLSAKLVSFEDALSQSHYDLVVCNPPFFSRSLPSKDSRKALARHQSKNFVLDLITTIERSFINLTEEQQLRFRLWLLLPPTEWNFALNDYQKRPSTNLHAARIIALRHRPSASPHLLTIEMASCNNKTTTEYTEFCLKDERDEYSQQARELLKDYYLFF